MLSSYGWILDQTLKFNSNNFGIHHSGPHLRVTLCILRLSNTQKNDCSIVTKPSQKHLAVFRWLMLSASFTSLFLSVLLTTMGVVECEEWYWGWKLWHPASINERLCDLCSHLQGHCNSTHVHCDLLKAASSLQCFTAMRKCGSRVFFIVKISAS